MLDISQIIKERNIWWLIVGISGISSLAWFTNTYEPTTQGLIIFFGLLFLTTLVFGLFVTTNARRSILLALGIVVFFLLRFLELREFFYSLLLIASLVSLEVYLNKR